MKYKNNPLVDDCGVLTKVGMREAKRLSKVILPIVKKFRNKGYTFRDIEDLFRIESGACILFRILRDVE